MASALNGYDSSVLNGMYYACILATPVDVGYIQVFKSYLNSKNTLITLMDQLSGS